MLNSGDKTGADIRKIRSRNLRLFYLCFGLQTRLDGKRIDIEFALLRSKAGAGPADYATL